MPDPSTLNVVDVTILGTIAVCALPGINREFLHGMFGTIARVLSVCLAIVLHGPISAALTGVVPVPAPLAQGAAIVFIFGVAQTVLSMVPVLPSVAITTALTLTPQSRYLNTMSGAIPGAIRGAIVAGLLVVGAPTLPIDSNPRSELEHSYLSELLAKVMTPTIELATDAAGEATERFLPVLSPTPVVDD